MDLLTALPILLPALAAAGYAVLGWNRVTAWFGAVAAAGLLATAVALAAAVVDGPRAITPELVRGLG